MSEYRTEAEAVAQIAYDAAIPDQLDPGTIYSAPDGDGDIFVFNTDEYAPTPRRKTGTYRVTNVDHFIDYLTKHANPNTELWGNPNNGTVKAVINAHGPNSEPAGWEDHTLTLTLTKTDDWNDWTNTDRKWQRQVDFAEFVEDHLHNFMTPTAADMLELAQSFTAHKTVAFESGTRTNSGATTLVYRETIDSKAGRKGDITIPDRLELKIPPFEGFNEYKVPARFRYRINDGALAMSVALERPRDILNAAFEHVTAQITDETNRTVWLTA